MPHVTKRTKLFRQCTAVIFQFHIVSSLPQDIWLVAVKTNIEMLSSVTGAQEMCCNLKLCNFLITRSAFMQHHCGHTPICSHLWSHSFFSYTVSDQALYLQNMHKHKISLLPSYNITYYHSAPQQFCCYMCSMLSPHVTCINLNCVWDFIENGELNQFNLNYFNNKTKLSWIL
jgi:hypothetical protein